VDGGRFDRAEGGLLAADRAWRRATNQAEAADAELERLNAAVQEFLAEQAAGREQSAAIALKKAVRTQLDPNRSPKPNPKPNPKPKPEPKPNPDPSPNPNPDPNPDLNLNLKPNQVRSQLAAGKAEAEAQAA
tara:strand:- start:42 stop:437 length:396 start_codon:yes stop_codon:yes gene_type:complete